MNCNLIITSSFRVGKSFLHTSSDGVEKLLEGFIDPITNVDTGNDNVV